MKLLVVYNICGISGQDNYIWYSECIQNILDQDFDDFKLVVSSCLNNDATINYLRSRFKDKININWVKNRVPVNVSFNHSVLESIKRFGKAEGYVYVDSGCDFTHQHNVLQEMYDLYKRGPYGLVSIRTDTNTGFPAWLNIGKHDDDSGGFNNFFRNLPNHYVVPIGKAINLHCQLYGTELVDFYGKPIIDIMAGEAHESVYSFIAAALDKKWVIHKDLEIHHQTSLDGASSGFAPWQFAQVTGQKPCYHGFCCNNISERMQNGHKFGLGFEEISGVQMHDSTKFDENGYAICSELRDYIKNYLYLNELEFNYSKINSVWS